MIRLDEQLLNDLGLEQLSVAQKNAMLATIYEEMEMRVGAELARSMTDSQLDDFEQFIHHGDEDGALAWLETNFPHYRRVVTTTYESVLAEIRSFQAEILAASVALLE